MKNFINKIKQFFKNIISKNKIKRLESSKETKLTEDSSKLNNNHIEVKQNNQNEKKEFFELYNRVKNQNINLFDINKDDLLKIRKLLLEEAKIQDEKFEDEIRLLEIIKKVS